MAKQLALLGGTPFFNEKLPEELLKWPIITEEDEAAALDIIRRNAYSGTEITKIFEKEFAQWLGMEHAVAYCNGTASLSAAMFGIGLGAGDEIICPTKTYWASIAQASVFGATAVFCNVNENLSMDPDDLERCISPRTKAIMVVHYCAYPCDMDAIMAIARKHNLMIIEDCSHAQGGMYKGKRVGTFGDVAAMSLMSEKSFSAGELGILVTNNRRIYERAMAFGHYERNNADNIKEAKELEPYFHIALGGMKGRANQLCVALARIQLKYYDERCAEVRKAMNYFWDLLEGLPGIRPLRVDESTGSNMAGCYTPKIMYHPEELNGLSVNKFVEALRAEGLEECWAGANYSLHKHQYFKSFDFMNIGKPSRIAFNDRDVLAEDKKCDSADEIYCFSVPCFKHCDEKIIARYADAIKKVVENYKELLDEDDAKNVKESGQWYGKTTK